MKHVKHIWFISVLLLSLQPLQGQGSIVYCNGPAFQLPVIEDYANGVALAGNNAFDCSFSTSGIRCTTDMPISFCSQSYYAAATGTNALLWQDGQICVMPAGNVIGCVVYSNTVWGDPGKGGILTSFNSSPRDGASSWTPPLQTLTNGYLGVRFCAADGAHYGWIHARLPDQSLGTNGFPSEFSPVIVDWAYETRVNSAIMAGARTVTVLQATPQVIRQGYVRLNWQTEIGKTYQIQSKEDLSLPAWRNLDFMIVATATNAMTDIPMTSGATFYRIVEAN